jgi:hypothetical protein
MSEYSGNANYKTAEIARLVKADRRVRRVESSYATEEDYKHACEALDDIISRI